MVVFHLIFDMTEVYSLVSWRLPPFLMGLQYWGGVIFVVLSGLCVTLGSRALRRGAIVFGAGMLCTLVTALLAQFGFSSGDMIIRFGVLHCLGVCMLLWPLLKRLPLWLAGVLGVSLVAAGLYFATLTVDVTWLFPLGLTHWSFASGDYYPLLPHLGWFLLGSVLGRTLYRRQQTLLPKVYDLPFLRFCGRHSLFIYLLHQPLLMGALTLLRMIL